MYRFILALALLSLTACGGSSNKSVNSCGSGIVNGTCIASSSALGSSTVSIVAGLDNSKEAICTGTLIGRSLVLTAQHCAQDTHGIVVIFGERTFDADGDCGGTCVVVDNYKIYSSEANHDHDLAILHLSTEAPSNFTTQALPSANFDISAATSYTNVGYGITTESSQDAGFLRATTVPATNMRDATYSVDTEGAGGMFEFNSPTTGVCHGDSGGPLFANSNGSSQLVGVAEAVSPTDGDLDHQCHGVSLFVDVRKNLDWIQKASSELLSGIRGTTVGGSTSTSSQQDLMARLCAISPAYCSYVGNQ